MHLYFLECFVKYKFYINNEPFLREHAIKQYVYTSPGQTLYNAVLLMLKNNYHTNKLDIHEKFPKDMLVNIFRPYLFYYYVIHYNIKGTEKIFKYKNQLHIKLRKFYEYNNLFGRIKYTAGRSKFKKTKLYFNFNTDHINFYNITSSSNLISSYLLTSVTRLNGLLDEQYDSDELFYTNELSNTDYEYNTDYED